MKFGDKNQNRYYAFFQNFFEIIICQYYSSMTFNGQVETITLSVLSLGKISPSRLSVFGWNFDLKFNNENYKNS